MPIPTAVVNHGITSGDESRELEAEYTAPGTWDSLTRYYHVDNANWRTGIAAVKAIDAADAIFTNMYVRGYRLIESSGSWHEVAVIFAGRLNAAADKKTRVLMADTWTATRDNVTFGKIAGARVHDGISWGSESAGSVVGTIEVTHGSVVIEDTYITTTVPDCISVGYGLSSPGASPYTFPEANLPINPWSLIPDPVIKWPYGWVLQSRSADEIAGTLFLVKDRFAFVHKYSP